MDVLPAMGDALSAVTEGSRLLYLVIGVVAGLIIGALPGTGGTTGIAILMPFALFTDATAGIGMIIGVLSATSTADTFAAVLFAIPGSSSSQASILDGHPMARKGEAVRALSAAFSASLAGGLIGVVVLTVAVVAARPVILAFQSPELFMLGLLGLSMMAVLSGHAPAKGLIAGAIGLFIGMIGAGPDGVSRWTMGSLYLYDGIDLTLVALGIFALPEIATLIARGGSISSKGIVMAKGFARGLRDTLSNWFLVVRTALLGVGVGILPGLGGSVVDWFAYGHAYETSKGARETFGKGDVRGVIGVDAATNAKDGGSLVPTLLFGIPGSPPMALLLGVFLVHGIHPGPSMVSDSLNVTYAILWSLLLAQLLTYVICSASINLMGKITLIPFSRLGPFILLIIYFAAYQARGSLIDLLVVTVLGAIGILMKVYDWPRPPLVLALVLAPILERYFYISALRYGAAWLLRPIVMVVLVLIIASLSYGVWGAIKHRSPESGGVRYEI